MARQTSIAAYNMIESQGLLSDLRLKVYKWLFEYGPSTQNEVCKMGFADEQARSITPRFAELRARGVLRVVGERECLVTGVQCEIWDVTDQLPREPLPEDTWQVLGQFEDAQRMVDFLSAQGNPHLNEAYDVKIVTKRIEGVKHWKVSIKALKAA